MDVAESVNGVPIRLPDERWAHILYGHPEVGPHRAELLATIRQPDVVVQADDDVLAAIGRIGSGLSIVVLYREVSDLDGFVITGWLTSRIDRFLRKDVLWAPPS